MAQYTEELKNGITVYRLQSVDPSTIIDVRDAIVHATNRSPNMFRAIIVTNQYVNTASQFATVLSHISVLGKINWQPPGYKIAIIIEGNAGEMFSNAEDLWDRGGFLNKLAAAAIFAIGVADGVGSLDDLMKNPINNNQYVKVVNSFFEAENWVSL